VKKHSKTILLIFGGLFVLSLITQFAINRYAQSDHARLQIQNHLSHSLHLPVQIKETHFSFWSGLHLSGISVPNSSTSAPPFLQSASFSANYRLLPLLIGKLSVPSIKISQPRIVWPQNAQGRWTLPIEKPSSSSPKKSPKPPSPKSPKSSSPSDPSDPSDLESFLTQLRHAELLGGSLELLDKDLLPCLVATNIQLHTTNVSPEKIEGLATIDRLVWKETLVFENLSTPFTYTNGQLSFPSFTASLGGGPVKASFSANLHSSSTAFTLDASFAQTNLDTLSTATGGQPGKTSGIANSQLHLSGPLSLPNQITGSAELAIADAQFSQLGLFQSIGKALNSRELADLRIQSANCNLLIANHKASIALLKIDSPNLHITADQGSIGFDKKIDVPAQLVISKSLLNQLPDLLKTNFTPTQNDQSSLLFKITGTTDKVSTNLIEKLTGIAIPSQLIDVLSGFLNPKNRDDEKKKKADDDLKKEEKKRKKDQAKMDAQSANPPVNP
jgi:uncharacterized protein involved in outer membrane biogenesis